MASCSQVNSLFQAFIDGELGHAEKSILEQHLCECGACREELNQQKTCTARVFEALSEHRLHWGLRSRVLAHLPEMDPPLKGGSHPTDPQFTRRKPRRRYPWALAMAAAAVVVVALFVYGRSQSASEVLMPVGMVTFSDGEALRKPPNSRDFESAALKSLIGENDGLETLADGRMALALIAGSTVKINHNSSLRIEHNRRVAVDQGQTFFDIGRDRRHFYVETPTGEILVFGTAFLVDVALDTTTVTVTEGDILVSNALGQMAVSKGNQLVFRRNEPLMKPYPVDIGPLIAWADAIVPDPEAMALFRQTLELRRSLNQSIPAEPVYAVRELQGLTVSDVLLSWAFDGRISGHCSYIIHVADSEGKLLLLKSLDSGLFDDPARNQVKFPLTDGPVSDVDAIYIRLIPDYASGEILTEMDVSVLTPTARRGVEPAGAPEVP